MNIWQFQRRVSQRLMRWAVFSILSGLLLRVGNKLWRHMGNQFIVWGAIDACIAFFGQIAARNRIDHYENPGLPEVCRKEERNLRRLLWLNFGLDALYMLGGWYWVQHDKGDGTQKGSGWGVILQAVFLLVFDLVHALNTPNTDAQHD